MMNYKESVDYINEASKRGSVLGLENIENLMNKLGNVQDKLNILHIAGTNGKGSTSAYICEILIKAGYRVGKYTSPTVFDSLEVFSVNNENISRDQYCKMLTKVKEGVDEMIGTGMTAPTSFEIETALAFVYFQYCECDIVIIETGLGGRFDATNIIKNPLASVITSISMDHMKFLGNTIEKIAYNKAGIIKKNSNVISAIQLKEVYNVISEEAFKLNAKITFAKEVEDIKYSSDKTRIVYKSNSNTLYNLETVMLGTFQSFNVCTAIETIEVLRKKGFEISKKNIEEGIKKAVWHGRFEKIGEKPLIYFDGGHNPGAARNIKESLEIYFTNKKIVYIIGVLGDKDYDEVLKITANKADEIITITPRDNVRALDGKILLKTVLKYNTNAQYVEDLNKAVDKARELAGIDGVVIIFGSLSYLGLIKKIIDSNES